MSEDNILVLSGISKSFFGAEVLHRIGLEVRKGEVLGLVGENGAGKSTLMNILGGVLSKDSGRMEINGTPYVPASAKDAQRVGISFIHQELSLFSNLSVAENMFIEELPTGPFWSVKLPQMQTKAQEYINLFDLQTTPKAKVGTLPMGVRQTVEIAKALIKKAEIIIFDEPTTSLSQKEKEKLFSTIRQVNKDSGITIIYISHILEDVFSLCNRIAVIRDGEIIGVDETQKLQKNQIIKMMVGRELNQIYPKVEKKIGKTVLSATNVSRGLAVHDVSIEMRSGEIVGLFGLMGAGRTELVRCLFGLDKMESGKITFRGKKLNVVNPRTCIKNGIAFVTEDRRQEGLMMPKSVKENLVAVKLDQMLSAMGMVNKKMESEESDNMISQLGIRVYDKNRQTVKSLSGGNQQKVVLGKWIMRNPSMFILDEPTRGVDVGAKHEIYLIINTMAKEGATVLFVSSEMEELMGVCDRILIMHKGRIAADIPRERYDQEVIMNYALGGGGN